MDIGVIFGKAILKTLGLGLITNGIRHLLLEVRVGVDNVPLVIGVRRTAFSSLRGHGLRPQGAELEDLADTEAKQQIDNKEEGCGHDHHDQDHDRSDPSFLAGGPGDLTRLGADLADELRRVDRLLWRWSSRGRRPVALRHGFDHAALGRCRYGG